MTRARFQEGRGYTQADWDEVSDNPEWTPEEFEAARPFAEVLPDLAAGLRRDALQARSKQVVSLALSADVLERFKAGGPGWPERIDEALREAVGL